VLLNQKCERMNRIAIYTLTSSLHDEEAVGKATREFLDSLELDYEMCGADFSDYGTHALDLIYVRTGGTEGIFQRLLPQLVSAQRPFYLLASGKSNSLAASLEILSYLNQKGLKGEVIHGSTTYVKQRLQQLMQQQESPSQLLLNQVRMGMIGKPSDWLIASRYDAEAIKEKLGAELVEIGIDELLEVVNTIPMPAPTQIGSQPNIQQALPGAEQIYEALKVLVKKYCLNALTLRCFDLLPKLHNTGCLALARLNAEGVVATCEGDVPAMLTMMVAQKLWGKSGFQSNPASVNPEKGELLLAHCTIPLNMVSRYEYDTHFESGIGVGIRGYVENGPVTIMKIDGGLKRFFVAEGMLMDSLSKSDLCRTQLLVKMVEPSCLSSYFLKNPIGNHHVVVLGHHRAELEQVLAAICG